VTGSVESNTLEWKQIMASKIKRKAKPERSTPKKSLLKIIQKGLGVLNGRFNYSSCVFIYFFLYSIFIIRI
jgi:hypothetical protein